MPYTSRRTRFVIVGLAIALVLSLAATAVIAVAWSRDRDANRAALANDAQRIHILEGRFSSAQPSVAPPATEAPTTSSSPLSSTPAASPVLWPYAQLTHMTDSLGDDWIYPSMGAQPVQVNDGTVITFTAYAKDGINRPLEYVFWQGVSPTQKTICAWGAPRCTWTAHASSCTQVPVACDVTRVYVAVRGVNATSWAFNGPCYKTEPCDTDFYVSYNVLPPH